MPTNTPKKILIVDDDKTMTTLVEGILRDKGYEVITSYDGLDAMIRIKTLKPDLILLDIMMPEINGYDVCSHLKFDEGFKNIPIIIITSREQELDPRLSQLMGIDYMQKPVDTKLLIEKICKIFNP
ncbi:MAG: response regulator [Candidatus Omnitrophica bacterium]|nr:response regulator [Candidatus Omnitrophota bacterium]